MKNKILIIGSEGCAGYWLKKSLNKHGYRNVYRLDRQPIKDKKYFQCSIINRNKLESIISKIKPDYIFHLASDMDNNKDYKSLLKTNYGGTKNILNILLKKNLLNTKILVTSSSSIFGDKGKIKITEKTKPTPANNYGYSKLEQEKICLKYHKKYQIKVVVARPFNNFAPGPHNHGMIPDLINKIVNIERKKHLVDLKIDKLETTRDYIDTRDAVEAYQKILFEGQNGVIYNVCSGKAYSNKELLNFLISLAKKPIKIIYSKKILVKNYIPFQLGNNNKIKNELDWSPQYTIYDTLTEMLKFYRNNL